VSRMATGVKAENVGNNYQTKRYQKGCGWYISAAILVIVDDEQDEGQDTKRK
jgi:hypothetical protein